MSGKKDHAVVVVVDNLTKTQAGRLQGEFAVAKNKVAPQARAIAYAGDRSKIGNQLEKANKKLIK